MNEKLEKLYESKWNDLLENVSGTNAAHPLLIKVNNEYQNADIKVMIVGQETDKWNGLLEEKQKSVNALMNDYQNYFYNLDNGDEKLQKRLKNKQRRPFWNRKNFKFFEQEIPKVFKEKKVSFIWNNISKIGKHGRGKPTDLIQNLEETYFANVFEKELEILNPDIIIFVTGNRKIPVAHNHVPDIKYEQVSEVKFANKFSNMFALRTYHPNARIKGGKRYLKEVMIERIKFNFK